jgi:hypothetical protein
MGQASSKVEDMAVTSSAITCINSPPLCLCVCLTDMYD